MQVKNDLRCLRQISQNFNDSEQMAKFLVISEYQDPPSRPSFIWLSSSVFKGSLMMVQSQALDDWTHFFWHFHPFGDPYDMFMQLFYL